MVQRHLIANERATDNVISMASHLSFQECNFAAVSTAVANSGLSKKSTVDVDGEILELKNTFKILVDHLNSFALEATRVARELSTKGQLGDQVEVAGTGITGKDLIDSIYFMAANRAVMKTRSQDCIEASSPRPEDNDRSL